MRRLLTDEEVKKALQEWNAKVASVIRSLKGCPHKEEGTNEPTTY